MIVIVDYGVGNLPSVEKAVLATGFSAHVTAEPVEVASAEKIILPGVGSFQKAMAELE
ncbi:MAG: imidazole glycerol phosphate synthase subunit HisH, partial [Calditrichaeota bacterium]